LERSGGGGGLKSRKKKKEKRISCKTFPRKGGEISKEHARQKQLSAAKQNRKGISIEFRNGDPHTPNEPGEEGGVGSEKKRVSHPKNRTKMWKKERKEMVENTKAAAGQMAALQVRSTHCKNKRRLLRQKRKRCSRTLFFGELKKGQHEI